MFTKILLKSAVGTASFAAVLASVQYAAPATTTVSPDFVTVACNDDYADSVFTKTSLKLDRAVAQYGAANTAHVVVTSNVDGKTPTGTATVTVVGQWSTTISLNNGKGNVTLPHRLAANNTYSVRARYNPSCAEFRGSSSDTKEYTVVKAGTNARASAPDISRGDRPRVRVSVDASTSVTVNSGRAAVRLFKNGDLRQRTVVDITGGDAVARFKPVRKRGLWEARVHYLGARNFQADSTRTTARVTR